jgi:uncharacterized membrane protein YgcG
MSDLDLSDPRLWLLAALVWAALTVPSSSARGEERDPGDFGGFGGGDFGGGGAGGSY